MVFPSLLDFKTLARSRAPLPLPHLYCLCYGTVNRWFPCWFNIERVLFVFFSVKNVFEAHCLAKRLYKVFAISVFHRLSMRYCDNFRYIFLRYYGICRYFLRYCGVRHPPMSPSRNSSKWGVKRVFGLCNKFRRVDSTHCNIGFRL